MNKGYTKEAVVQLHRSCPLCQSLKIYPIKSELTNFPMGVHEEVIVFNNCWVQLLKCTNCKFRFTKEIPHSPTFFQNRYDNSWFDPKSEVTAIRKTQIIDDNFSCFEKYRDKVKQERLLDIGSFSGKLLYFAQQNNYIPEGVEVNPKLAKFTESHFGFKTWCAEFQKVNLPKEYYDFVTIIDVLEHLKEPRKVLEVIHNAMKKNSFIYIKVPNGPMQIIKQNIANFLGISGDGVFATFGHINHFNVLSLSRVLKDIGYNIKKIEIAKSEQYQKGYIRFYKIRNIFRAIYYHTSTQLFKHTGIVIGLNINIIAQKN